MAATTPRYSREEFARRGDASLTLPPALIGALGLRWQTMDTARLADGSGCIFSVFEAEVLWDGAPCARSWSTKPIRNR